jgi:hypothetical protein
MSELAREYAGPDMWLLPPEGILEGSDFDIAQRFIEGTRADIDYYGHDQRTPQHIRIRYLTAKDVTLRELDVQQARLEAGDADLAASLATKLRKEIAELDHGNRLTVTGQAHLLAERQRRGAHAHGGRLMVEKSVHTGY